MRRPNPSSVGEGCTSREGAQPMHRGAQSIHPRRSALLPSGPPAEAEQSGLLRRRPRGALVGAEAQCPPAGLVARGRGGALPGTRVRAVEPPSVLSSGRCTVCSVNLTGSRMWEIRTYGLSRGCWPVSRCTAGWGLLNPRAGRIAPWPTCSGAIPLTTAPSDQPLSADRLRELWELGVGVTGGGSFRPAVVVLEERRQFLRPNESMERSRRPRRTRRQNVTT